MLNYIKRGLGFGVASGIITTIGTIVGLAEGTGLRIAIIGGILTVAVADAFSDALGIHISEETNKHLSHNSILKVSLATFISKLLVGLSFLIPFLFFSIKTGVILSLAWGLFLLVTFTYYLAKIREEEKIKFISKHLIIALAVIIITYLLGDLIKNYVS